MAGTRPEEVQRAELSRDADAAAARAGVPGTDHPRVMHVITHLDVGGAELVAVRLIEALADRFDFSLFAVLGGGALNAAGRDLAARLAAHDVPVAFGVAGRFKSGGVLVAAARLARAMARRRPDVVHLHTEIPELTCAVATIVSARARRTALLRTVHNCELWIDWAGMGRWVTGRLAHGEAVAVSQAAAKADAAIATRAPRARADVIYNAVASPASEPRPADGCVRVLFAGRFVHQKGPDLLPAIIARAHALVANRSVEMVVAGSGAMEGELRRALVGVAPGWTVRLEGPVERLSERLASYDCLLLPSRFEGFPLLPLETLLAGVPLVTTDAPGLDELLPEGYPLAAPVDDVETLARHLAAVVDAPEAHRAAARQLRAAVAARFSPAVLNAAYAARYTALAAGARR